MSVAASSSSSEQSCNSVQARKTCNACGKPPTTTFSEPLRKCASCRRLYHGDCQFQASVSAGKWLCTKCTIRKRPLEISSPAVAEDTRGYEPPAKRLKIVPEASQDLNSALDSVTANARNDPRVGYTTTQLSKHRNVPLSQYFPTFSSQSKELSPPYSPGRQFDPSPIKHFTSEAGTQASIPGSCVHNAILIEPKMEDDESLDGIPLGDDDANAFLHSKKFPCAICRRSVLLNPSDATCSKCASELPRKLQFATVNKPPRPGSLRSNPMKLEETQKEPSAQLPQVAVQYDQQYFQGVRSTIEGERQQDSINSDPFEHVGQMRNKVATKVQSWQQNVKPMNSGSSLDDRKTRASRSDVRGHVGREGKFIQENYLHDRLRNSNAKVEDLTIQVRNLTSQLSESKRGYARTLREKEDELSNAKNMADQDRRNGQKHIAHLKDEVRALKDRQRSSELTNTALANATYSQKDYEQLKDEFHALRREKRKWQAEKLDLERRVQNFGETLGNLEGMKDSHTKLIKKLRRKNERLTNEVGNLKAEQENRLEQEGLAADYERLNADNANLQQGIAKLREELASKEQDQLKQDQLMQEAALRARTDDSHRRRSPSPTLDIKDFTPILHQDLLPKQWPLFLVDVAAKPSEIASRKRIKELAGPFSQQARKERGTNIHHTKSVDWTKPTAPHDDDDDDAASNGSSGSNSTARRMVAVHVPSRLSSEERSVYSEHHFDSDDYEMADDKRDDPSYSAHRKFSPSSSRKSHRPRRQQREETAFVAPEDEDEEEQDHSSNPSDASTFSSSGIADPVDLETRGAPLKSSLAQLKPRNTDQPSKSYAAAEDSDVSPPPPTTRNERSMASLLRATGMSNKEMRPGIRNGKLCMEEVSGDEGQGLGVIRRARRKTAWPVL